MPGPWDKYQNSSPWSKYGESLPEAAPPPGATQPGFLSNLGSSAVNFASGVVAPVVHPEETLEGITGLFQGMAEKSGFTPVAGVSHAQNVDAFVDFYKNRYGSIGALKHALYTDPVGVAADFSTLASGVGLGAKGVQLASQAARFGKTAQVAGTVARTANRVSSVTDPLRVTGTAAQFVAAPVAERTADFLRRSALKGGYATTRPAEEVRGAVQAMGELNAGFSQRGLDAVRKAAVDLRAEIANRVQSAAQRGATIDPAQVQLRADALHAQYGPLGQVNPTKDIRDITAVQQTFGQNWPGPIPVDVAQGIKVGSGKVLGGKYGKASAAQIEAEKALTRGLKEELELQIPELASLNPRQQKLINLEDIMGKALNKYINSGGFMGGLGREFLSREGAIGAVLGLSTGHADAALAVLTMKALLSDPKVKTSLAQAINAAQRANPSRWGGPSIATALSRVDAYQSSLETDASQAPPPGAKPSSAAAR